jgi:hypothetical protein
MRKVGGSELDGVVVLIVGAPDAHVGQACMLDLVETSHVRFLSVP